MLGSEKGAASNIIKLQSIVKVNKLQGKAVVRFSILYGLEVAKYIQF